MVSRYEPKKDPMNISLLVSSKAMMASEMDVLSKRWMEHHLSRLMERIVSFLMDLMTMRVTAV